MKSENDQKETGYSYPQLKQLFTIQLMRRNGLTKSLKNYNK